MLYIAGIPFQQSEQWPAGSTERLIIHRMKEDSNHYSFQSREELNFELTLRKNIILSGKAMSEGEAQFETFASSRCNPSYWNLTDLGGFQLNRGISPSAAIRDIFTNSSLYDFECATAIIIILAVTTISSNHVPDDLYERVRQHFDEKQYVDLLFLIITNNGWNRLAIAVNAVPGSYKPAVGR